MRAAIQAVADGGHSVFSPSGSKMWLGCAGSLIPNIFAPDDSGEDAAYGTVGHMVGEVWLKTGLRPGHLLGTRHWVEAGDWGFQIEVDEVMLDYVKQYVDWCRFLPGAHYVETRVDFSELTPIPGQGGTADHCACAYQRMVITDLKMGKGVHVYAEKNSQALLYALGFFYEWDWLYDFQEIVIRIAQPRRSNMDTWTVSREYLLEFAEYVRTRAHAAWVQNAPRTPSAEACQWCKVQTTCTARMKQLFDMSEGVFTNVEQEVTTEDMADFKDKLHDLDWAPRFAEAATLSTADLDLIFKMRSGIESLWNKIAIEISRRAANGERLRNWKLVETNTKRAMRTGPATTRRLMEIGLDMDDVLVTKMASPRQIEDLLRKHGYKTAELPELLEGLWFKPPGKATLAPMHDRRPAITDVSADIFIDTTLTLEIEE